MLCFIQIVLVRAARDDQSREMAMNRSTLYELLIRYFDEEELRTVCFKLEVEYDNLRGEGSQAKARELIKYLDRRDRISDLVEICERERSNVSWRDAPPLYHRVPFTNREYTIDLILIPFAPPYHLIDAPAGYGKTELLLQLKKYFQERGWACAYVSTDKHRTLRKLVEVLSEDLALGSVPDDASAELLGFSLGALLTGEQWEERVRGQTQEGKAGLAFLIDLGKSPSPLLGQLLEEFIPGVEASLQLHDFFDTRHNRFRVVLAGRYLTSRKEITSTSLPLNRYPLHPLTYKDLRLAASYYLRLNPGAIEQISACIMHVTGGHPGCMAYLLEMYRKDRRPADVFLNYQGEEIRQFIESEVEQVYESIPSNLRGVMDALGMFRYLNYDTLSEVVRRGCVPGYDDAFTLMDDLTTAFLMGWKDRLLRNDSVHRLLALRLRQQEDLCVLTQDICKKYLGTPNVFRPELWVIEYLYQYLQRFTSIVQDRDKRRELRDAFLNQEVPEILQSFVSSQGQDIRWQKKNLNQALDDDEEFHFTVNYYLRDDQYSDKPYQAFVQRVNAFFADRR
jgi:hypothetical protein